MRNTLSRARKRQCKHQTSMVCFTSVKRTFGYNDNQRWRILADNWISPPPVPASYNTKSTVTFTESSKIYIRERLCTCIKSSYIPVYHVTQAVAAYLGRMWRQCGRRASRGRRVERARLAPDCCLAPDHAVRSPAATQWRMLVKTDHFILVHVQEN